MSKAKALIFSIVIILIGSFISFYSLNLIMSDIGNMFYGVHDVYFISSLPLLFISIDFDLLLIFVIRRYRYPEYKKKMSILYSSYLIIVSIIGVVFSIITGVKIYHSFIVPYPFFCYPLLMLIFHLILMVLGIVLLILSIKKMENDVKKRHVKVKYAVYSGLMFVLFLVAFYRFGSVLWSPFYIQFRTFHLTFPFYLWSLLPLGILIHLLLYSFDLYKNFQTAIIYNAIIFGLNFVLGFAVIIIGSKYKEMISAISPALPLERLANGPYDTIIDFVGVMIFSVYYLIYSSISYKRSL